MSQGPNSPIHRYFLGRDVELKLLQEAWQRARRGDPQFVILLAESGFGKTRLVQEFYCWLSHTFDDAHPKGYWPDSFVHVEDSMDVNPRFPSGQRWPDDADPPIIPWLWWGLRFTKPGDRRNDSAACSLERYIHALDAHLAPILWARQRHALTKQAIKTAASTLTGLTPVAVLTAIKDIHELLEARKQEKEGQERARMGAGALAADRRQSLAELALDAFQTLLDPKRADAHPVPVILVLDDAQWADRETLDFVEKLLARAYIRKWPLLVIATHWEREWNEQSALALPDGSAIRSLADVYQRQATRFKDNRPTVVDKVADLTPMLIEALPGLTEPQRNLILHRADGNPLLMIEIVRYLQRNSILFVNRMVSQELTASGEERVRRTELTLHALARDRFESLQDNIKDVLEWSSYQGVRYLRDITRAIAATDQLQPRYTADEVESALKQADTPLALVHNDPKSSISEFRQVTFHEVARNYLDLDVGNIERVQTAIRRVLTEWLRDGRLASLSSGERLDALRLAAEEFEHASTHDVNDEAFQSWAKVMALLHAAYRESYAWSEALRVARILADEAPKTGWPLDVIPLNPQAEELLNTLYEMRDFDRALRLANQITARLRQDEQDTPQRQRDLSISLDYMAVIELAQGDQAGALAHYQENLAIRQRLRDAFGATPESLHDVAVSLSQIAVCLTESDRTQACHAAEEALSLLMEVQTRYQSTPQAQQDVEQMHILRDQICQ